MIFTKFTVVQNVQTFYHSRKILCPFVVSLCSCPLPPASHHSALCLIHRPFPNFSNKWNHPTWSFLCLASFTQHNITVTGLFSFIACIGTSLLFVTAEYLIVWKYHILYCHPPVDRHLDFLQCGTIKNKPAMNISIHAFVQTHIFISLGQVCRSRIAGSYSKFMFNFLETAKLFSKAVVPFHILACNL